MVAKDTESGREGEKVATVPVWSLRQVYGGSPDGRHSESAHTFVSDQESLKL